LIEITATAAPQQGPLPAVRYALRRRRSFNSVNIVAAIILEMDLRFLRVNVHAGMPLAHAPSYRARTDVHTSASMPISIAHSRTADARAMPSLFQDQRGRHPPEQVGEAPMLPAKACNAAAQSRSGVRVNVPVHCRREARAARASTRELESAASEEAHGREAGRKGPQRPGLMLMCVS